jgi:hypothetical protein
MTSLLAATLLSLTAITQDPGTATAPTQHIADRQIAAAREGEIPFPSAQRATDPAAFATLRRAQTDGPSADNETEVAQLLAHDAPTVVARACWLLGTWRSRTVLPKLAALAATHPSDDVRIQAMQALKPTAGLDLVPQLLAATEDSDRRVRTLALQTLIRLSPPELEETALAVLDRHGQSPPHGTPTDLIVCLIALHDLGKPANLLPAAASVELHGPDLGQALAFLFQGLSPRLGSPAETKTLIAVVDHEEPMLRRYAIQRLGELGDDQAVSALRDRLAMEGRELEPLLRVTLAQLEGDLGQPQQGILDRAKDKVAAVTRMVEFRWATMTDTTRYAILGGCGGVLTALLTWLFVRRRRMRSEAAAEASALVGPSPQFGAENPANWPDPTGDVEAADEAYDLDYQEEPEEIGVIQRDEQEERY